MRKRAIATWKAIMTVDTSACQPQSEGKMGERERASAREREREIERER